MSIRFKLGILLTSLFLAAIANTLFTFQLEEYGEEKLKWVIHTHTVLMESEILIGAIKDTETGQRGYLLTQSSEYLEPYHIGISKSEKHLNELIRLTSDNPKQQQRLANISALLEKKFDELAMTINLTQEKTSTSISKALAVVKESSGKRHMDAIRAEITKFQHAELVLLEQRKGEFKENRAYITTVVAFEILFFIFMAIITTMFIRNKLYQPLGALIDGTVNMEKGMKLEVSDIMPNDEMGFLLSRFYKMSEAVYTKTQTLDYKASRDPLTGLKNRAKYEEEIEGFITALSKEQKLALLFIDLNNFKKLNDTKGHDAGDAALIETAKRLKSSVRSNDEIYRLGGDEFIIIINGIMKISQAKLVVEKLLANFSSPFNYNEQEIELSLSIGVAIAPNDTVDSQHLIKLSDVAMYAAKLDDKESYKFFDDSMLDKESDK